MVKFKTFWALLLITSLSCSTDKHDEKISVENFVVEVSVSSSGNCGSLPEFQLSDISYLLQKANSFKEIECFPRNPSSSKITDPFILGECLLWVVEGVRQEKLYASLEPHIVHIDNGERINETEFNMIYELYEEWYSRYQNSNNDLQILTEDILENTGFRWN